ncbi:CrpP-related protein [Rhizobium leguminosarum]|uniref:CrpP-related protein n=1 Tax=Rhizobium leguminosarum TaxID=384 RepID=UPI001FEF3EEC|nr:CrpP-related protein [Rhizobium leguminosarum]
MTIEELVDIQEAGARARVLGTKPHESPYLAAARMPTRDTSAPGDWLARHDAWKFGWEAEDASRDGRISSFFRNLIASHAIRELHQRRHRDAEECAGLQP